MKKQIDYERNMEHFFFTVSYSCFLFVLFSIRRLVFFRSARFDSFPLFAVQCRFRVMRPVLTSTKAD